MAIFAFPLVVLHFQSAYIDFLTCFLLASAFCATLILTRLSRLRPTQKIKKAWFSHLMIMGISTIGACWTKNFAFPIVVILILFILAKTYHIQLKFWPSRIILAGIFVLSCGPYLHNLILFHNPLYPFQWSLLHIDFDGPLSLTARLEHQPDYLPALFGYRPALFVLSISDFDWIIRGITNVYYNIDMHVGDQNNRLMRTGGLFGPYVMAQLACFIYLAIKSKTNIPLAQQSYCQNCIVLFCLLTMIIAFMPLNYELRLYLIWPVSLVLCNAILIRATMPQYYSRIEIITCVICLLQIGMLDIRPNPLMLYSHLS